MSKVMLVHIGGDRQAQKKAQNAIARYEKKYGVKPGRCEVNPKTWEALPRRIAGVAVKANARVQQDALWMGA